MKIKRKRFSNIVTARSILSAGLILLSLVLFSLPLFDVSPLWATIGLADQGPDAAHAGPDLVIESITLDPENPKAGDSADITVIIKNQGDVDASGYRIHLYVDPTDNPPTQNTLHTATTFNGFGLAAGASSSAWSRTGHEFTVDNWTICAWVDRNDQVAEDDETNNLLCIPERTINGEADDFEKDDLCTDADAKEEIPTDGTAQDHNLFREGGEADQDWVAFTVKGGVTYVAEAKPKAGTTGEDADLSIEVHTVCSGNTFGNSSGAKAEFTPPTDGKIYLLVQHSSGEYDSTKTAYELSVNGDPSCSTAGEPNNICANAAEIGAGTGPQTYAFCEPDDVDWLRIPTQAGAKYKINLTNEGADPQVSLFSSCDQAAAKGSVIEFTAPSAGFAYLMVENLDPSVHGRETAYQMEVIDEGGCTEDDFEQDDSQGDARPLTVGSEPRKYNVCPSQDVDWLYFDATGGVTHTVETLNLAPSSDTVLCLYDATNTEIACDDDEGPGKGSRLVVIPSEDTRYWAKVRDYNPEVAGSEATYEVQVLAAVCEDDDFEPNDTQSTAQTIATDGSTQVHNVCPRRDADWVKFTASANTAYAIDTVEQNREGDTIIELYDAAGNRLARNDDFTPGVNSQLIFSFETAGTYYVKTDLYNPTSYGTGTEYELTIKPSDVTPTPTPTPTAGPPVTPTPTPGQTDVETLILVNRTQIVKDHSDNNGDSEIDQLMGKLDTLAKHEAVMGHVIRLDNNSEVSTAYANWNADLSNVTKANLVTDAIRRIVLTYIQERTGVRYVVLVGDDRALPFRRVHDNTPRQSEETYKNRVDKDHPTGAAIHGNNYLVDDFFVDAKPNIVKGHNVYIPDLAIGRLIETPEDMINTIDTFLANPSTIVDGFYVSGYDFVSDLAQDDCKKWGEALADEGEVMCLIESDTNRWSKDEFISGHLRSDPSAFKFQSISGHAEHYAEGVSGGGSLLGREINSNAIDLSGGLLYTVGCHGGLNVPSSNAREPIDLAEAYVRRGANYVGNSGYGWGLLNSIGLSERTYQLFSKNLRSGQYSMGEALKEAKNTYFKQDSNISAYDEKVLQQMIFYGLPMYGIEVGSLSLGDDDPFEDFVNFDAEPLPLNNTLGDETETITRTVSIDFGPAALGDNIEKTKNGSVISLNGSTSSGANEAELPLHYGTLSSGDDRSEEPRSVLVLGAEYTVEENFDPAVGQPYNEFYTDTTELLAQDEGWFPAVPASLQVHNGEANLLTTAGQYNADTSELRLYSSLAAEVYYSTSSDEAAPTITIIDSLFYRNTNNVSVKVGATDESEIDRVVVSYFEDAQNRSNIKSLDMVFNASNQKWEGTFVGDLDFRYFVQVVDKAGNMTTDTNKGNNHKPEEDVRATTVEPALTPTPTPTLTPTPTPTPPTPPPSAIKVYLPVVR